MPNSKQSLLTRIPNSTRERTLRYLHATPKMSLVCSHTSGDDDDDFWNDSSTYGEEW